MRTKIIITYNWNDGANGTVAKNHLETLDNIAEMNIREQMEKGFTSGDLEANLFDEDFSGHWSRTTERVDENALTIQEQIEEREEYFSLNYKKKEEALENQYQEKQKNLDEIASNLEKSKALWQDEYKEKTETALKNHEKEYQKKLSDLEAQYRTKLSEIEERKEIIENARQEKIDAVQFYQLGANLNLNHEVKIAHYPNGFEKKIESDAYRLFIGVGKEGLIEMLMSGETFKALLKNEPIDAISLEDFKKNYL